MTKGLRLRDLCRPVESCRGRQEAREMDSPLLLLVLTLAPLLQQYLQKTMLVGTTVDGGN